MIPGFPGCKDHWEVELEKVSKSGLVDLVGMIIFCYIPHLSRESLLKLAQGARKTGRFLDAMKDHEQMNCDLDSWFAKKQRQRASAKKAARNRKRRQKKGTA